MNGSVDNGGFDRGWIRGRTGTGTGTGIFDEDETYRTVRFCKLPFLALASMRCGLERKVE